MNYKYLSGLDLKVGGEGMRGFYDQIVPQVAQKVLKQLGGKVAQISIAVDSAPLTQRLSSGDVFQVWADGQLQGEGNYATRAEAQSFILTGGVSKQTGFDITPAMYCRGRYFA